MKPKTVLFGAGGHASVLIDCIRQQGAAEIVGILDSISSNWNSTLLEVPIIGNDGRLPELIAAGATHFAVGFAGIGPSPARRAAFEKARAAGLLPLTVVHPSAVVSPYAVVGAGVQIFPGAVVNACAKLGEGVIVNSLVVVEHDCEIGAFAHVACGACLSGGVVMESNSFVGAGATVIQKVRIGANALVAAGAVVLRDVPPMTKVGGVPAVKFGEVAL